MTSERKIFFLQFITGIVEASNKSKEEPQEIADENHQ
jgi:hypothetical protein